MSININTKIINILKPLKSLGVPVSFQTHKGLECTYIVFNEYLNQGEEFSEDDEEITGHYIQINLFSKIDYTNLIKTIKTLMKKAGFKRLAEYDLYDTETRYYNHVFRFFYLEESEEE